MHDLDSNILRSMLEDERRNREAVERQLEAERAIAIRWEHEAKALRKELNALRQSHDTAVTRKR
jgi:hypothetical protein